MKNLTTCRVVVVFSGLLLRRVQLLTCFSKKGKRKRALADDVCQPIIEPCKPSKRAKTRRGINSVDETQELKVKDVLSKLQSGSRGNGVFVCESGKTLPASIVHSTSLTALTSVFSASNGIDETTELCPKLVISTVTHEEKQLYWGRKGVPLCEAGDECHARCFHGSAMCGPLPIYLYPEEQMMYERNCESAALKRQWAASGPRFCLMCYRLMAHTAKLACDASAGTLKLGGIKRCVVPPFTNLVDVPDGYRLSAMGVTPADVCMAGSAYICSVTKGLEVKFNQLANCWFFEQTPEIVFTVEHADPCL